MYGVKSELCMKPDPQLPDPTTTGHPQDPKHFCAPPHFPTKCNSTLQISAEEPYSQLCTYIETLLTMVWWVLFLVFKEIVSELVQDQDLLVTAARGYTWLTQKLLGAPIYLTTRYGQSLTHIHVRPTCILLLCRCTADSLLRFF